MTVVDTLSRSRVGDLSYNFWKVHDFLKDDFISAQYIDPAHTNNVISNDLNLQERRAIAAKARESLSQSNWNRIVW